MTGAASGGPLARGFSMGGASSGTLGVLPGFTLGGGTRDFELRGFPRSPSSFTRVFTGTAELRVPLFLIGEGIWRLPVAVHRVSLSIFGEAGGGWRTGMATRPVAYRDLGAEVLVDITLIDAPIGLRAGVARGLTRWVDGSPGRTQWYFALGPSF
jgi:hypothetical protein